LPYSASSNSDPVTSSMPTTSSSPSPRAISAGRFTSTPEGASERSATSALPGPPTILSSFDPPLMTSLSPGPPASRSAPAAPRIPSLPRPPQMRSAPPRPSIRSSPARATITSRMEVPLRRSLERYRRPLLACRGISDAPRRPPGACRRTRRSAPPTRSESVAWRQKLRANAPAGDRLLGGI
jgi:hypothetical protein